ncbi:MAG: acyl carrier protein [Rikenellaceae bacterium]
MELIENIKNIVSQALNIDASVITNDLSIGDIPEWDSVGNLTIISALESELNIEFPLEVLFELTSIESIIEEIKKIKND